MDAPSPKEKKYGLFYGLLSVAAVVAVVLLLWQPWHESAEQPTAPTTVSTEPGISFENGIIFHYLPDAYDADDASASNQLELTQKKTAALHKLLEQEKWFDLSLLSSQAYPIGSFELVMDQQVFVYEFTAGGLVMHDGKYARMVNSWPLLSAYMAQSNSHSYQGVYCQDSTDDLLSMRLQFNDDGSVCLLTRHAMIWRRLCVRAGEYLLILDDSKPSVLAFRVDENGFTFIEPYSDSKATQFSHGDAFLAAPDDYEPVYGYLTIFHVIEDYLSVDARISLNGEFYEELRGILDQFSWVESDRSVEHEELFILRAERVEILGNEIQFTVSDDWTLRMEQHSTNRKLEAMLTYEQMRMLLDCLGSVMTPMQHEVYQTGSEPIPAAVLNFRDRYRFVFLEEGNPLREGTYLHTPVYVYLFFDDGQCSKLTRKYASLDIYSDWVGRQYAPNGQFPE